jgi:hypothetical protein
MYPATLAMFLSEHSYAGEIAIGNAIRNYGYEAGNCPWDILTSAGNYRMWPVPGGFHVRLAPLTSRQF